MQEACCQGVVKAITCDNYRAAFTGATNPIERQRSHRRESVRRGNAQNGRQLTTDDMESSCEMQLEPRKIGIGIS